MKNPLKFAFSKVKAVFSGVSNLPIFSMTNSYSPRTGIGTDKDPLKSINYIPRRFTSSELANLYIGNGMCANIVDMYTNLAFSKPIKFDTKRDEQNQVLTNFIDNLGLDDELREAFRLSYIKGSSIIVMGLVEATDKSLDEAVDYYSLKRISWMRVLDRDQFIISKDDLEMNPNSKRFGQAKYFTIKVLKNGVIENQKVHHSRVLVCYGRKNISGARFSTFSGVRINAPFSFKSSQKNEALKDDLFGLSFLEPWAETVIEYETLWHVVLSTGLKSIREVVYLNQTASTLGRDQLKNAVNDAVSANTNYGTIVLPEGFKLDIQQASLASFPELLDRKAQNLAGKSGVMLVNIIGKTDAGFSNTMMSEVKIQSNKIHALQELILRPLYTELFEILIKCSDYSLFHGKVPRFSFEQIVTETEEELATLKKLKAETFKTLIESGVELNEARHITGV